MNDLRIIVRDGAQETWHFVFWNGFRPRASGLDVPVVFPIDTFYYADPTDSLAVPVPIPVDTTSTRPQQVVPADTTARVAPPTTVWSVQLAAVLSEDRAKEIASTIRVDGFQPRVIVATVDGTRCIAS